MAVMVFVVALLSTFEILQQSAVRLVLGLMNLMLSVIIVQLKNVKAAVAAVVWYAVEEIAYDVKMILLMSTMETTRKMKLMTLTMMMTMKS